MNGSIRLEMETQSCSTGCLVLSAFQLTIAEILFEILSSFELFK
jgi:hypothetical protein